ncbi:hypothetical protein [Alkalihalobacillus sp. AL-G]|uniref:hypothetical protein n=1 Tax=Alkalihalobacillus sp. AL-G TaxID=2926399 RepID=UPI00272C2887|nr:hypothetical protein [Alkalihalobacillus sp. AL-G]WLD92542.1 hypothetical protein MOJ78_16205 [Alkalihalobacillus sp. AL-G]
MSNLKLPIIQTGDWIKGKSINDEMIQGYIHSIHPDNGTVNIYVTISDHTQIIGKNIEIFIHRIEPLTKTIDDKDAYLENLIDVALLTKDREWFMEVWDRLDELRKNKQETIACCDN